jgi:UDP-N-acetylglucosamine acyltransferase
MNIHPTAIVDPKAELAGDVEIGPFTLIGPHVHIGAGTVVGPHCVIEGRTVIGEGSRFFSGSQIGILSQDLKHQPKLIGRTVIGNRSIFREHVTVSASTMENESEEEDARVTSIGDDSLFMAYSHVGHDCHVGNRIWMANCASLSGHVDVEDGAILGGLSGVHQMCFVGKLAFVGGMGRINKDALPYMITEGHPARCCGPNVIGLQRNGFDAEQRKRVKLMFRLLCRSGLNTAQAVDAIEEQIEDCEERNHLLGFIGKSTRGVIT